MSSGSGSIEEGRGYLRNLQPQCIDGEESWHETTLSKRMERLEWLGRQKDAKGYWHFDPDLYRDLLFLYYYYTELVFETNEMSWEDYYFR
jgi:hypothetical protein